MATMTRSASTRHDGAGFDDATKRIVWNKGKVVLNYDQVLVRQDACGMWMVWEDYGNRSSKFGWEIDHIKPVAAGGTDDLTNLQPLNWQNNNFKSDSYPQWSCYLSR
jgi:hypothetical protein